MVLSLRFPHPRHFSRFLLLTALGVTLGLSACGKSDEGGSGDGDGDGDEPNGDGDGDSGTGAAPGDGDGDGDGDTGGSPGDGDGDSGGTMGDGDTSTGGLVELGGNGGQGGAPQTPSYCEVACEKIVAAGCDGGPTDVPGCIEGCEQFEGSPCEDTFLAVEACGGTDPTFYCDDQNRPIISGCEEVHQKFYACFGPCTDLCEDIVAAGCDAGPDLETCISGCSNSLDGNCSSWAWDIIDCVPDRTGISCDQAGIPVADGCEAAIDSHSACVSNNIPFCQWTCPDTPATGCANAPSDKTSCLGECSDLFEGSCATEMDAVADCYTRGGELSCSAGGDVLVSDCVDESLAVYQCLNQ